MNAPACALIRSSGALLAPTGKDINPDAALEMSALASTRAAVSQL